MKTNQPPPATQHAKRDVLLREARHDSYKPRRKPPSPRVCPGCKAVFQEGRWQWTEAPASTLTQTCPACQRIHDDFPAGYVTLKGEYLSTHRDELLQLAHNHEAREKAEHPLQRIMKVVDTDDGILITTTDVHLARGIGDALHHAHHGKLDYHYNPEQTLLRVQWER
jgi:NMD protein affecting ribosome stability and mRNA decay